MKVDRSVEEDQLRRLAALKRSRSRSEVAKCLKDLETTARKGDNILPPMIEAAKGRVTIGEMCDVLRQVYGTFEEAGRS
jgi:methylmalonyl-CoA mutase N-terminal domain/subunit